MAEKDSTESVSIRRLNNIRREVENQTNESASVEYDKEIGSYVELKTTNEINIESIDKVCEKTDCLMQISDNRYNNIVTYRFK
jgi:hypothetical protein